MSIDNAKHAEKGKCAKRKQEVVNGRKYGVDHIARDLDSKIDQ
jgi:hypothetical protein